MKKLILFVFLLTISLFYSCKEKKEHGKPKSVFIATNPDRDWPNDTNYEKDIASYRRIIDTLFKNEVTQVFLQVKGNYGTLYNSKIEPVAAHFPQKEGRDLLKDLIKIAKDKNIKTIAWINPYRLGSNKPNNIDEALVAEYDKIFYLNPGLKESRNYIARIANEVLSYDIDGLMIDDYFYPDTTQTKISFNDLKTFEANAEPKYRKDINAWRRNNISELVKSLSELTRASNKLFYVSPRGIWRNAKDDKNGSQTSGNPGYDAIHADVRYWLNHDWIDVIVPQIYWSCDNKIANFNTLSDWWIANKGTAKLNVAMPAYKVSSKKVKDPITPDQFQKMQNVVNAYKEIDGISFIRNEFLSNLNSY
jgi:uncharacterized lipoprotein YddW (UPF0748 family)